MSNRINYTLAFTADTRQAKMQMQELQNQISNLISGAGAGWGTPSFSKEITNATAAAAQLKVQLADAMNTSTGKLNLTKFNASLRASGTSIGDYRKALESLGPEGTRTFANLATSITTAETPLVSLGNKFKAVGTSLKNTISWQLSSSVIRGFIGTFQSAFNYAENLNKSLNNIRIVTGQSADEMAKFAEKANNAAKALSSSTLKYTEAALIYYQQGLSDSEVEERTNTTIKMANVTGESSSKVSSYMTAIWNNFDDGSKSLEYYSDVITALGAATAASSDEIAGGLEKFAAIGSTVGLSYEYATAALTTIIDKTRQSEDVVGNALKTIFARIQGLQQGETQDDGVTLNKYSKALENVGINILESNGKLKEMDSILDELGAKWQVLGEAEKVALAQTVGGTRQYAQLISLMDNWDSMKENLNTATTSEGTLQKQQEIYAESWKAANEEVKASAEGIYQSLIDDKFFISITKGFAGFLKIIEDVVKGLGGMRGMFLLIGTTITTVFQKQAAAALSNTANAIRSLTPAGRQANADLQQKTLNEFQTMLKDEATPQANAMASGYMSSIKLQQTYLENASKMGTMEKEISKILLDRQRARAEEIANQKESIDLQQKEVDKITNKLGKDGRQYSVDFKDRKKVSQVKYTGKEAATELQQTKSTQGFIQNFSNIKNVDEAKAALSLLNKTFEDSTVSVERFGEKGAAEIETVRKALQQAAEGNGLNELKKTLDLVNERLSGTSQGLETFLRDKVKLNDADIQKISKLGMSLGEIEAEAAKAGMSVEEYCKKIAQMANMPSVSSSVVTLASKFTQLSMAINQIKNLGSIFADEDLTAGEKFVQILTSLGMLLPAAIGFMGLFTEETARQSVVTVANGIANIFREKTQEAVNLATLKGAAANALYNKSFGIIAITIGIVIGTLWLLVQVFKAVQASTPEAKLKAANEELERSKKAASEASSAYGELKSSIDSLNSAKETLAGLTVGTEEWKQAVIDLNQQVLDLIEKYPILAKYMTSDQNGVLGISEEGLEVARQQQAAKASAYQRAVLSDSAQKEKLLQKQAVNELENPNIGYESTITKTEYGASIADTKIVTQTGTNFLTKDEVIKIAKDLQLQTDEKGNVLGIDFEKMGAEYEQASESYKKALNDNIDALLEYQNTIQQSNSSLNNFNKSIIDSYLNNNVEGLSDDRKEYVSIGASKVFDKYYEEEKNKLNLLSTDEVIELTAKTTLGPGATDTMIQGEIDALKKQYEEDKTIVNTWKEAIISREAAYESYQEVSKRLQGIEDTDIANIVSSAGDSSSYNYFNEQEYDSFKKEHFNADGALNNETRYAIQKAYEDNAVLAQSIIQNLEETFSDKNKETYLQESELAQEKKFQQDIESKATNLGIDPKAMEGYVNNLIESNEAWKDNKEAALASAEAHVRWNKGAKDLAKALEENEDALDESNKGTIDYYEALGKVAKASEELFGLELSTDYVEEHLEDLKKAVEGDEEAIENLQKTMASDWARNFAEDVKSVSKEFKIFNEETQTFEDATFDGATWASNFTSAVDQVSEYLNTVDPTMEITADTSPALQNLITLTNEAMAAGEMTEQQMRDMFSSLNYSPEVTYETVKTNPTVSSTTGTVTLTKDGEKQEGWQYEGSLTTETEMQVPVIADKDGDNKISFSKISSPPSLSGATKRTPSKSSSGGGSQKESKNADDEIERYHKTNKTLESLRKNLDNISKAKDKAFGKSKIDLIDQEIKKYDELIKTQEDYVKEIEQNLSKDRGAVEAYGAEIDENGVITNYEELMQQALNKYNNSGKTEADEEAYNNFKESISQYEETLQLWEDENSELTDMISEKLSKKLEKVQYKLELKLDISESDMEYVEYMLSRIEDKAFSAAEAISLLGENTESLINQGKAYEESIKGALEAEGVSKENISKILNGQMKDEDMAALGLSAETIEIIKNAQKGLLDVNKELLENQKSVWEQINVVIEETVEAFDKQAEAISHASSVLSHYRNIVELVGQENLGVSNAMMDAAADANINNAMASLTNSKAQLETLQAQRKDIESKLAVGNLTKDEEKYFKESLENIDEQIQNAEEKMLSDWENVLEQASQEFENAVTRTIKSFEKAMSGTFGNFERLQDAFNKQKELGDIYLDDYKKIYELSKLTRDINKSLETTDNIKGKEILRDLQQEINTLEAQGVKLSEYDVQNLRAKYDLRLAEIALEEAQNAKTQVRMTRNSEGNWSYVYTADENKMAEAEQNYEDKLYAMQELNANYIENLQSMILTAMANMSNELAQLNPAEMTDEQYKSEQERISNHYMNQISMYKEQMYNALGNSEQTYSFWSDYSEKTGYAISANEAWVDNFEETQLSILTGFESLEEFHQNFVDSVGAPGVKGSLLGDLTGAYDNWSSRVSLAMQAAGTSMDGFKNKFGQVIGETNRQAEKSVKEAENLKDKYVEYMGDTTTAVVNWRKDHLKYLDEEIKKNEQLYKTLGDLINAYTTYSSLPPKKDTPPSSSGGSDNSTGTPSGSEGGYNNTPSYTGEKDPWTEVVKSSEEYSIGYRHGQIDKEWNRMKLYQEKYKTCVSYVTGYNEGYKTATVKHNLSKNGGYQYMNDDPSQAASGATGMYTGSWGSSGKLAILHEKELVLNKKDTENILKSVDMVRNISNMIDLNASLMSNRQQLFSAIGGHIGGGEIMQNITINADFPNAQDQNEIKAAFDNLLNKASQYINRKR